MENFMQIFGNTFCFFAIIFIPLFLCLFVKNCKKKLVLEVDKKKSELISKKNTDQVARTVTKPEFDENAITLRSVHKQGQCRKHRFRGQRVKLFLRVLERY